MSYDKVFFALDLGSNIGPYTLASRAMGNNVISVDPNPENQVILYNSLGKYFMKYILFEQKLSWSKTPFLYFFVYQCVPLHILLNCLHNILQIINGNAM